MTEHNISATAAPTRPSLISRIARFPLTWMVVGAASIVVVNALLLAPSKAAGPVPWALALGLLGSLAAPFIYRVVMRMLARRAVPEMAVRRLAGEAAFGIAIGTAFIGISVLIVVALGGFSFHWSPDDVLGVVVPIIVVNLGAAIVEEFVFRGLVLQAVEQLGGRWVALAITSALFGIIHLGNPGATLWSGVAIAIQAGVLLGAAFLWRRNLWFAVGIHFAWNVGLALLGVSVSGHAAGGLFTVDVAGPALLTGGDFGLEASIVPVILGLVFAIPMLVLSRRAPEVTALR
ncbi:hypothetical protein FB562_0497 [Homoserinimonas aerilata]|uniref:CAAX prenyl protease 2/Lysostaphin resistance protein A-like domain-containing protein n=1 Tax=Homoserinimonas aerilata TaxID=1162970 RepID=A0A542YH77_9MICO|nr:CPBP family intramembrane glutamic endopeptidase [Homoserinimonas aerilata]TQL47437.1 hypothetical protein FB562_0497 [Homoserinimonas aerilata]